MKIINKLDGLISDNKNKIKELEKEIRTIIKKNELLAKEYNTVVQDYCKEEFKWDFYLNTFHLRENKYGEKYLILLRDEYYLKHNHNSKQLTSRFGYQRITQHQFSYVITNNSRLVRDSLNGKLKIKFNNKLSNSEVIEELIFISKNFNIRYIDTSKINIRRKKRLEDDIIKDSKDSKNHNRILLKKFKLKNIKLFFL